MTDPISAGAFAPAEQILVGLETEYGFSVEGRGADDQVDDAVEFVAGYPGPCFVGWDACYESPRADLRGFSLEKLAVDPDDARRDAGRTYGPPHAVRADRILPNGARFYNDHGHPEYATPECRTLAELVEHDKAGELVVARAGAALARRTGRAVRVYKNNSDFHGSSYGSHESYLVPRELGFQRLYEAVLPVLVARQLLCGAGKTGAEVGAAATYQLSARADFFVEPANAETLYRRPIFNTRDEPHADPAAWIRLHVISGDANMLPGSIRRKVGLVKLALLLEMAGAAPRWALDDPVEAIKSISRDESFAFKLKLQGGSWTTAYELLESYFAAAETSLELDPELRALVAECRALLPDVAGRQTKAKRTIDWAAKRSVLETALDSGADGWRDPALQAYDLEYHNVDPAEGLAYALAEMGEVEPFPEPGALDARLAQPPKDTRAWARGLAVARFAPDLVRACWRSLTFRVEDADVEVELPPNRTYPPELADATDVGSFVKLLRSV